MPANIPVVFKNGSVVDVTYSPTGIDSNGVATFRDRTPAVLSLQPTLSVGIDEPRSGGRDTLKGMSKLTIPVEEVTVSGTVIRNDLAKVEFLTGKKATVAERKNLRVQLANWLLTAEASKVFDNPESFW